MPKIVLTGPESSGKSTLSKQLSEAFELALVPEFARTYLAQLEEPYTLKDVEYMANQQLLAEERVSDQLAILDTDLVVYAVWLKEKYQLELGWISKKIAQSSNKVYLLCDVLDSWEDDPQREHPNLADRRRLFDAYVNLLEKYQLEYHIVSGNQSDRLKKASDIISSLI